MRKIQIVGLALAAIFAFSMVSASGASALTLWDECKEVTAGTGLFTNSDCNVSGSPNLWEWLPMPAATPVDSLATDLVLLSTGLVTVEVLCEGSMVGTVGLNGGGTVTELLNLANEAVSLTNLVVCMNLANCPEPLASPENLPWNTQLVNAEGEDAAGLLLGPHSGGGPPGWFVECMGNGQTNECTKPDTVLLVENLEAELEVDLVFPASTDTANLPLAECSNGFSNDGFVVGSIPVLLANAPERALRAD
jgi:hypothetical protein